VAREQPAQRTLRLSVLDRLLDDDPERTREAPLALHEAFRRAVQAVRRDLEWLLNTRLTWVDDRLLAAEHAARSIATFGLQDFTHENLADADARQRLRRAIERTIATFEPRLARVAVTPEAVQPHQRAVHFRIDAILRVDPIREPVSFDTVMDTGGTAQVVEV
jgi:type VI secretion system protein ImpF